MRGAMKLPCLSRALWRLLSLSFTMAAVLLLFSGFSTAYAAQAYGVGIQVRQSSAVCPCPSRLKAGKSRST